MKEQLELIKSSAMAALAAAQTPADLEELRVKVLGKKGELTAVLKMMGKLSPRSRRLKGNGLPHQCAHWFAMTHSRNGRVIPLQVLGVIAPEKAYRESGKCGWYRGRITFRPECGMEGLFIL